MHFYMYICLFTTYNGDNFVTHWPTILGLMCFDFFAGMYPKRKPAVILPREFYLPEIDYVEFKPDVERTTNINATSYGNADK